MAPGRSHGEPEHRNLQAELEAERAATDHWRRLARQRSVAFAELRHRPAVRVVLALERRLGVIRRPLATTRASLRELTDRLSLIVAAVGRRPRRRLAELTAMLARLPAPIPDSRRIALVVVGSGDRAPLGSAGDAVEVVVVEPSDDTVDAVARAIESTDAELVGVLLATTEPIDDTWLRRLAAEVHDGVTATAPLLVHPHRDPTHATPHDGLVRAAGLTLHIEAPNPPELRGISAGATPEPERAPGDVAAASAAGILFDRSAYNTAGGLPRVHDLDLAIVELCTRLRACGGRVLVVPSAVMIDHRAVRSRRDLRGPVDGNSVTWRDAIDRFGPALARSGASRRLEPARDDDSLRFAVTVAAPSMKVAAEWGDWHLAHALARALRRRGHDVLVQTVDHADDATVRMCDVHLVLRGLEPVRRSAGQRHVLWIISHPESIEDEELDAADLVLVASERFAGHLRTRTTTPVEILLQATDQHRFHPRPIDPTHRHPVTVVAKTREVLRPVVADAITVGLRPSIYGGGWRDLVDPSLIVADHVDNEELPAVYSSAGVVLNDHWRTMQAWGFVSNRLYDVLACGIPVISDPVSGLAELFDGGVLEYHSPMELRELVDQVLADPIGARDRAERGRAAVIANHTFDQRAAELISALQRLPGKVR